MEQGNQRGAAYTAYARLFSFKEKFAEIGMCRDEYGLIPVWQLD